MGRGSAFNQIPMARVGRGIQQIPMARVGRDMQQIPMARLGRSLAADLAEGGDYDEGSESARAWDDGLRCRSWWWHPLHEVSYCVALA